MEFNRQLRGTLYDLIADLEKSDVTKSHAANIRAALKEIKTPKLHRALRDKDSDLSKSIPEELLKAEPNGQAYLEIIAEVRKGSKKKTTGNNVTDEALSEYGQLTSLANSIKDQLGDDVPQSMDQFTPDKLQSIIEKTKTIMEAKYKNGELDVNTLQTQLQGLMTKLGTDPEFQAISSMLGTMGGASA